MYTAIGFVTWLVELISPSLSIGNLLIYPLCATSCGLTIPSWILSVKIMSLM